MKKLLMIGAGCLFPLLTPYAWQEQDHDSPYQLRLVASDPAGGGDATISPDGRSFVTTSKRRGNWDVWRYDLTASAWTPLTTDPGDDFEGKLSPDGRRLVFCSTRRGQKDIWILDLKTKEEKRLTTSQEDDEYPAWSPDGKYIVYTNGPWGRRDIYIIAADGGIARRITRRSGKGGACAFEPGGATLICHRYDLGTGDVYRMWVDDGDISPLTIGSPWDYKPNTSPTNTWIAFSRAEEGPSRIFLLPRDGGRAQRLTNAPDDDRWPTWDDSGHRLFFHRVVERGKAVKVYDRQSGAVSTLVDESDHPLQASFDPSGTRIVYSSQTGDRKILKTLDTTSGIRTVLETGPGEADFPRWSPDGTMIAYVAKPGSRWEVAVIRADGSGRTVLTEEVTDLHGMHGSIDWSPDSSRLAFKSDTDPFESRINVINVKTRKLDYVTEGTWFYEAPSWAPDGKSVVFMSTRGGNWTWAFFRRSVSGGGPYELLTKPDWEQKNFPRLGRSGTLLWSMNDERDREFVSERSADGKVEVLMQAGEGARWPSYSRDESRILYTIVDHRVEYWLAEHAFGSRPPVASPAAGKSEAGQLNIAPVNNFADLAVRSSAPSREQACHLASGPSTTRRSMMNLHRR